QRLRTQSAVRRTRSSMAGEIVAEPNWLKALLVQAGTLDDVSLERVATCIEGAAEPTGSLLREAASVAATSRARALLRSALQPWKDLGATTPGSGVAAALRTLVHLRDSAQSEGRVELV